MAILRKLSGVQSDLRVNTRRSGAGQAGQASLGVLIQIEQEADFRGRGVGRRRIGDDGVVGVRIHSDRISQRRGREVGRNQAGKRNGKRIGDTRRSRIRREISGGVRNLEHLYQLILKTDYRDGVIGLIDGQSGWLGNSCSTKRAGNRSQRAVSDAEKLHAV